MAQQSKFTRIKNGLTRRVAELHGQGYGFDFSLNSSTQLLCLQNNMVFIKEAFSVKLVDQVYDKFSRQFKYIHTVETDTGQNGILLLNHILFNGLVN